MPRLPAAIHLGVCLGSTTLPASAARNLWPTDALLLCRHDRGCESESFAILATIPSDCLDDKNLAQYLYERGRCLAQRHHFAMAEKSFVHAYSLFRKHPEWSVQPLAWALTALAAAQIEQSKLNAAARSLHEVVLLTPRLPADVAEGAMRVVARYCIAKGDRSQYARSLRTIYKIVREESPCPVSRATAYLEMKLAEAAACVRDVEPAGALQASLRTLRRNSSQPMLVSAASQLLSRRCPPRKRIRCKTHAEEIDV